MGYGGYSVTFRWPVPEAGSVFPLAVGADVLGVLAQLHS